MASVQIVIAPAGAPGLRSAPMPVPTTLPLAKQLQVGTGASVKSTVVAPGAGQDASAFSGFWDITALDGAVWLAFGVNPTASPGNDWYLAAGASKQWSATPGDTVAVVNA